jgi:N-acetylmuramoyl-L-alanine amidase
MREGDYFVELDERVARANKEGSHAILVSIHYNATSNSSKNGAQTYFWRADSHGLATRIESHLASATGEHYGGVIRRRLRLTRNPNIRCVLCECAYLTNPRENVRVADPNNRQRIAEGDRRRHPGASAAGRRWYSSRAGNLGATVPCGRCSRQAITCRTDTDL